MSTRLMIGEVGYPGSDGELLDTTKQQQSDSTLTALRLISQANIPIAIIWVSPQGSYREGISRASAPA